MADVYPCAGIVGPAGDEGAAPVAALVLGPPSWCDGDFRRRSYGGWCVVLAGIAPPLVPGAAAEGPPLPGAAADGAGMFWFGIGQGGSHGSAGNAKRTNRNQ